MIRPEALRAELAEIEREIERERERILTIKSKAHRAAVRVTIDALGLRRAEIGDVLERVAS